VAERDRQPFLNHASGTFTPTSREWVLSADQWSQTYYQVRDGKLYLVENDNKEQQHREQELEIPAFIRQHAATPTSPYPELVAFLGLGERATDEDDAG
jgi:hypothetical protein